MGINIYYLHVSVNSLFYCIFLKGAQMISPMAAAQKTQAVN